MAERFGNALLTGSFRGTAQFGSTTLTSAGFADAFAAKLDPAGNVLWARNFGGPGSAGGSGVGIDAAGNPLLTGNFEGTAQFGSTTLTSAGDADVFAAKLDPAGNLLWARSFGGTNTDDGAGVAVDRNGNALLTGSFLASALFGSTSLTSAGSFDVFAVKVGGPPEADLSIVKTDSADPVAPGDTFSYTLAVANGGPDTAEDVVVTDDLPDGVTYVNASGTLWNCGFSAGTVMCTRTLLGVGSAHPITITVVAPGEETTLFNVATVTFAGDELDASDNGDSEFTTVSTGGTAEPETSADLAVSLADSPDPVRSGDTLTYILHVGNNGPDAADGIVATQQLPSDVAFVSASSGCSGPAPGSTGTVTCQLAGLAASATESFEVVVTVTAANKTVLTSTATVTSSTPDPNSANDSATATTKVQGGSTKGKK